MNKKMISLVAIAAALSMTAGCARRNRELPPAPPSESMPPEEGLPGEEGTPGQAVPGSRADFLQSVPTDRVFSISTPIRSTPRTAPRSTPRPNG